MPLHHHNLNRLKDPSAIPTRHPRWIYVPNRTTSSPCLRLQCASLRIVGLGPPHVTHVLYIVKHSHISSSSFPSPWTRHIACFTPCSAIHKLKISLVLLRSLTHGAPSLVAMMVPSVGDILKLSQVAWKIERAFTADKDHAPSEFREVETKVGALASVLKQLAETLHAEAETSLIQESDEEVQHGIELILGCCRHTITDLDSLVDHNQVIRKHRTVGGFAIERSWSALVFKEYQSMMWTLEGGDLHSLQDLLQVHTNSISLLIQALQRYSG
jgi:hypothetical protein